MLDQGRWVFIGDRQTFGRPFYPFAMIARYVHVEVTELRGPQGGLNAEADVWISLPDKTRTKALAQLSTRNAPFWRVVSLEEFGDPFVAAAIELIGEEELCARIATAAALWNVWDSVRAKDAL